MKLVLKKFFLSAACATCSYRRG